MRVGAHTTVDTAGLNETRLQAVLSLTKANKHDVVARLFVFLLIQDFTPLLLLYSPSLAQAADHVFAARIEVAEVEDHDRLALCAEAERRVVDRVPAVEAATDVKRHAVGIEHILENSRQCILFEPRLDVTPLLGPDVATIGSRGSVGEVGQAAPHRDMARLPEPVFDVVPGNDSFEPGRNERLGNGLIGAPVVFDDLS